MKSSEQQYEELRAERKRAKDLPPCKLPNGQVMTAPYAPMFYSIRKVLAQVDSLHEKGWFHKRFSYDESVIERLNDIEAWNIRMGTYSREIVDVL